MKEFIIVSDKDNVATALRDFKKGEKVVGLILQEDIKNGHKFAIKDIAINDTVVKYGEAISSASCDIKKGTWVHIHNTIGIRGRGC